MAPCVWDSGGLRGVAQASTRLTTLCPTGRRSPAERSRGARPARSAQITSERVGAARRARSRTEVTAETVSRLPSSRHAVDRLDLARAPTGGPSALPGVPWLDLARSATRSCSLCGCRGRPQRVSSAHGLDGALSFADESEPRGQPKRHSPLGVGASAAWGSPEWVVPPNTANGKHSLWTASAAAQAHTTRRGRRGTTATPASWSRFALRVGARRTQSMRCRTRSSFCAPARTLVCDRQRAPARRERAAARR